ncbi:MAG: glycosyl hydrolase [Acidobacteria bacterium]|nr:MAG: glycosyl hydrolase [Acidobacteriota bacterium]
MQIDNSLTIAALKPKIQTLFELSGEKIRALEKRWDPANGTPVFTAAGLYTTRGWTEWTQGFQFGSALLQFDATSDPWFLGYARTKVQASMAPHLTHTGVHDHGFNNVSTYGNLLRLIQEGRSEASPGEIEAYRLALKCSGAVQASRWTTIADGRGFIYSFNGPHSLFADTIRSLRSLAVAHQLGHVLLTEADRRVSLLERLLQHASVTADFSVYYGEGRDFYDVRGRVAHESIFNVNDGSYRCPNSQQGYSPFSTWTRGLAWIILGYAEQLEFLNSLADSDLDSLGGRASIEGKLLRAGEATCDFYIDHTCQDGIPFWDTGAPGLPFLKNYLKKPSDPANDHEPVDSSAAAIAAQGLWRLGSYLRKFSRRHSDGRRYRQAALKVAATLFDTPYLSTDPAHEGLILHSIYHRPRGWDSIPAGRKIPCGESSMWGDYHARELALMLLREAEHLPELKFFNVGK